MVDENGYDEFGLDEKDPNRPVSAGTDAAGHPLPVETRARRPTQSTPQPLTAPDLALHQLERVVPSVWETIDRCV